MADDQMGVSVPATPDFATYPITPVAAVRIEGDALAVDWADGGTSRFNRFFLRENVVEDETVNSQTRERNTDVAALPDDLAMTAAEIDATGAIAIDWAPESARTRHHPGWLRATADGRGRPDTHLPAKQSWDKAAMPEPVSFDGPSVLTDDAALRDWLRALYTYGLARLRGLPDEDDLVARVAERIGVIRSSSFGFLFSVESKPNPDSNAYTSGALTGHTDLPTREMQPGLQLLHCRENTCPDGFSTMVDGFRVAEALRDEHPAEYEALTTLRWVWSNRHPRFDYRTSTPPIELSPEGEIAEIRMANALRADPDMAEADVPRAYDAMRLMMRMVSDERFVCRYPFAAGDLVIFDNRRILHGRDAFNPNGGVRRLQGCYLDTDELRSRLRVLARDGVV